MINRYYFKQTSNRSNVSDIFYGFIKRALRFIAIIVFKYQIQSSDKKYIQRLNNILFKNRFAEKIEKNNYIQFDEKNIYEIEYGEYTVPSYVAGPNEYLNTDLVFSEDEYLIFGIGILDGKIKNIEDYHLKVSFSFVSESKSYKKEFLIPVNRGKNLSKTVGSFFRGKEFLDISISAKTLDIPFGKYKFSIITNFERNSGKKIANRLPSVIIKSPRLLKKQTKNKNIIIISCESLTDPYWLNKNHKFNLDLPGFDILKNDGLYFKNSYSQQDSTLPFMSTVSTGLFPSQHLLGDYDRPIYDHKLHDNVLTLSEALSNSGFSTDAITTQGRWDTSYGWSRGFDSFKVSRFAWYDSAPNSTNISNLLTKNKNHDSFIFAHIDRLHLPLLQFVPSQSPSMNDLKELNEFKKMNLYPSISTQLVKLDKIIYDLIQTLKYERIYDDSLIIVTGDHGISVPPKWKQGLEYAQYEEHIRVPYIIKKASWCKSQKLDDCENVNNASVRIFHDIFGSLDMDIPKYFLNSTQKNEDFKKFAFSETIYHPQKKNYALSVISNEVKYWFNSEIDWETHKIKSIKDERIYLKKSDDEFNEENNFVSDIRLRKEYSEIGQEFLKTNLSFHLDYLK
tara:strand:- start:32212 stop:34074 length:1863 start_codon:yes stop_codon:yes gene_type:complete